MSQSSWIETVLRSLLESLGLKRKIAAFLLTLSGILAVFPALAPFAAYIAIVADWLGVAAFLHATASHLTTRSYAINKSVIGYIAAFVGGLAQVAANIPALQPYAGIAQAVADFLGALTVGAWLLPHAEPALKLKRTKTQH